MQHSVQDAAEDNNQNRGQAVVPNSMQNTFENVIQTLKETVIEHTMQNATKNIQCIEQNAEYRLQNAAC